MYIYMYVAIKTHGIVHRTARTVMKILVLKILAGGPEFS